MSSAPAPDRAPRLPRQDRRGGPEDRRCRRARRHHVDPRHHRRQRRPADLPDRVRRAGRPAAVLHRRLDGHRLHAGAGHGHPADRLGGRPVRHQAPLHDRAAALHARLDAVRHGDLDRHADRLPRPAGPRRRHAHAARHDDHDPRGRPGPDGPPDGHPRRADAARPDLRPHPRRLPDRQLLLALDLPDQRADRHRRDHLRLARAGLRPPAALGVLRLGRHGADVARAWRCSSTASPRSPARAPSSRPRSSSRAPSGCS